MENDLKFTREHLDIISEVIDMPLRDNQQLELKLTVHDIITCMNRFKSLTENRSELVEKCVEAVRKLSTHPTIIYITKNELRIALTQVLNPGNTRPESAKTGVEEIVQAIDMLIDSKECVINRPTKDEITTALTKLLEK